MIQAIVFANRSRYQLYERTRGFDAGYAQEIHDICNRLAESSSSTDTQSALRYAPLREKYLLSVIFRVKQGNGMERRTHVVCVSFLMDGTDADRFFRIPFHAAAACAVSTAEKLLGYQDQDLPEQVCRELLQVSDADPAPMRSETPLPVLLTGAAYSMERKLSKQLYLQTNSAPNAELHNLIRFLPPLLRKKLRFHTGCISAAECGDLTLCYCAGDSLGGIVGSDFQGGGKTAKYWYFAPYYCRTNRLDDDYQAMVRRLVLIPERIPLYGVVRNAIPDWDTYMELSLMVKEHPTLRKVLELLPDDTLAEVVRYAGLQEDQLRQLYRAARRGSAVRAAVKDAVSGSPGCSGDGFVSNIFGFFREKREWILSFAAMLLLTFGGVLFGGENGLLPKVICIASAFAAGYFLRGALAGEEKNEPKDRDEPRR